MTPEDAFRAGAEAALNQLLPMVPVGAEKTARQWVAALSLPPETQEGAKKIEDQAWHEARRRRLYPLAYKNAPPAPASPRQEDREALTALMLGRTAPHAADAILAAGYQRVPPGYLVTPGPESGEAWDAMAERAAEALWLTGSARVGTDCEWKRVGEAWKTDIREEADAALRAALSPYAKETGDGE